MRTDKGIITIATGHYLYGRMAYNLAATIKCYTNLPICVLADDKAFGHLSKAHIAVFDKIINVDDNGVSNKYNLLDLSPFKQSIYMDADTMVTSPRLETLMDDLKDRPFSCTNEGWYNATTGEDQSNKRYIWWAPIRETSGAYNLKGKVYQLRSEFMYFDKSKEAKKLFATAKKIAQNPKVKTTTFAGGLPDEFAFQIAANMCGITPHIDRFQPLWWYHLHRAFSPSVYELRDNYFGVSLGGNGSFDDNVKYLYKNICESSCQAMKLPAPFGLLSKKLVIPSRNQI